MGIGELLNELANRATIRLKGAAIRVGAVEVYDSASGSRIKASTAATAYEREVSGVLGAPPKNSFTAAAGAGCVCDSAGRKAGAAGAPARCVTPGEIPYNTQAPGVEEVDNESRSRIGATYDNAPAGA